MRAAYSLGYRDLRLMNHANDIVYKSLSVQGLCMKQLKEYIYKERK